MCHIFTTSNQTGDHLNSDAPQCFKRQGIRTQREQIDSSTQTDRNIRAAGIMLEILNNRNILPMRRAYKLHSKMKMRGLEHSIVAITLGTYYILLVSCFLLPASVSAQGEEFISLAALTNSDFNEEDFNQEDFNRLVLPSLAEALEGEDIEDVRLKIASLRKKTSHLMDSISLRIRSTGKGRRLQEEEEDSDDKELEKFLSMQLVRAFSEGPLVLKDAINSKRKPFLSRGYLN